MVYNDFFIMEMNLASHPNVEQIDEYLFAMFDLKCLMKSKKTKIVEKFNLNIKMYHLYFRKLLN